MNGRMVVGRLSALLVLATLFSGCATTAQTEVTTAGTTELSNVERYHAAVNANAWQNGVDVRWVNPPDEDDLDEYTQTDSVEDSSNGTH